MKQCGEVIDRKCGDYDPLGSSLIPLGKEDEDIEMPRFNMDENQTQRRRIYTDESPRPDRNFMRNINNRLPSYQLLIPFDMEENFLNENRLKEWRDKFNAPRERK